MPTTSRARRLVAPLLCALACSAPPPSTAPGSQTRDLPRGTAAQLAVKAEINAGELKIGGGDCEFARVAVNKFGDHAEPEIAYDMHGETGRLFLRESGRLHRRNSGSEWTVCVAADVPLALGVELGAGESQLDIGNLDLRVLTLEMGAGELRLDLADLRRPLHATIEGGVGELNVTIPQAIGVRVVADKGIGSLDVAGLQKTDDGWVNEHYRDDEHAVVLEIEVGVGSIEIGPRGQ